MPEARLRLFLDRYGRGARRHGDGERPALIRFHDVRALPSPQAETVFSAYNAFFRRMRALCLEADAVAGLDRTARNARHASPRLRGADHAGWIDRYEPDDYPASAPRVADLRPERARGPGSAWPPGLDLALPAPEWAPTEAFLRAATILINEQGYRGASVEKISAHLRVHQGLVLSSQRQQGRPRRQLLRRTFERIRRTQDAAEAAGGTGWSGWRPPPPPSWPTSSPRPAAPALRSRSAPCRTACART